MTEEKTDRLAKIMNRTLSQHEIDKLNAMAGEPVSGGDEIHIPVMKGPVAPPVSAPVTAPGPVDDTEYIAGIVLRFHDYFLGKTAHEAASATLALAACYLKASAAVALTIKDKSISPAIPVTVPKPVYAGKKRGRPSKA